MTDVLEIVASALEKVYEEHIYLIENRVSERSIVFWFGIYFYELLKGTEFEEYDLDVEYNRNLKEAKRTRNFRQGTYPDLILHKRGSNDSNFLIIEFKPWWNNRTDDDLVKLKDFSDPEEEYKYDIGLSILLGKETPSYVIVQNGEIAGEL